MTGRRRSRMCFECNPWAKNPLANGRKYDCPSCGAEWWSGPSDTITDARDWVLRSTLWTESVAAAECSHYDRVSIDANAAHFLAERQVERLAEAGFRIVPTFRGLRRGFANWVARHINFRAGIWLRDGAIW